MPRPKLPQFDSDRGLPSKVDVIVIGGGIIGAATALELSERGQSVLVCEKGQLAGEQSSRNWGWVRLSQRDPREMELMEHALRMWDDMDARTGQSTGFTRCGILYTAQSRRREGELEAWGKNLDGFDSSGHMVRGAELDALASGFGKSHRAGFYTPQDGRAEPQSATHAIATAAQAKGACIVAGCAVRALDIEAGRIVGVFTEKGRVKADAVVLAGGAWSRLFLQNEGVFLPQLKVLGSVMRLSPVEGVTDTNIWSNAFSIRRRADGGYTVAAGSASVFDVVPDMFRFGHRFLRAYMKDMGKIGFRVSDRWSIESAQARPWGPQDRSPFEEGRMLDPEPSQRALRRALSAAREAFPALKKADVTQSWGGFIDVMPDEIPVISAIEQRPGLFLSTGYSGHGFGISPAAGRLTADLVTGDTPLVDPTPFRFDRY